MATVPNPTPSEATQGQDMVQFIRDRSHEQLVVFLTAMTYRTLHVIYPEAEVASWDIQKIEAEKVLLKGSSATLADAPFLTRVCSYHYGAANDVTRLAQLKQKAAIVNANAQGWSEIAAFVNGIRARTVERFAEATTADQVLQALQDAYDEGGAFASAAGI